MTRPVTPQQIPLQHAPWSLRLAGIVWALAGLVFVLAPALAAFLLRAQYLSVRGQALRAADLAERIDPSDLLRLEPYLDEFARIEQIVLGASGWVVGLTTVVYVVVALVTLCGFIALSVATARGANWARITSTVLAAVALIIAFFVWQTIAVLAWLPITALAANHAGLVLMALLATGIVLAWLPRSNRYVRSRALRRSSGLQQDPPPAPTPGPTPGPPPGPSPTVRP